MEENKRGDYLEEEGSEQKHLQEDTKNFCFMINKGDRRFEIPGAKFPGNPSNCMESALRDYQDEAGNDVKNDRPQGVERLADIYSQDPVNFL